MIGSDGLAGGDYATYWYFSSKSKGNIDFNSSTFLIGDKTSLYMHVTGDHNNQEIKNGSFYGSVDATYSSGKPYANRGNLNAWIISIADITNHIKWNIPFNTSRIVDVIS